MFKKSLFDFWPFQKPFRHQYDEYGSKTSSDGALNAISHIWHIKEKFVDKVQTILLTMHYCLFIIIRTSSSLWFSVKKASNYCPTFFLCYYSVWKLRSKYYKAPLPPPSLSLPQWSELTKKHLIRTKLKELAYILVSV